MEEWLAVSSKPRPLLQNSLLFLFLLASHPSRRIEAALILYFLGTYYQSNYHYIVKIILFLLLGWSIMGTNTTFNYLCPTFYQWSAIY